MIEVEYYFNSDKTWFIDFANSLTAAAGIETSVVDNKLHVSPSLGEGHFEFLELAEGLGIVRSDFTFYEDLKLIRNPVKANDYFLIHFSLSLDQVTVYDAKGQQIDLGNHLSKSIFYSSSGLGTEVLFPRNKRIKRVLIYASRSWILKQIKFFNIEQLGVEKNYVQNIPFQSTYNLDINSYNTAKEILEKNIQHPIHLLFLKGEVLTLISNFYKMANESIDRKNRLLLTEVERISSMVNELILKMNIPWPEIEVIAKSCQMSKTKFAILFQELYSLNYYSFYVKKELNMPVH